MERHEYERLIATIKAMEGVIDWRSFFGDKMTKVNGKDKKITEIMEQLIAAKSYDELDNEYKGYDEWVDDLNKGVSNMKQIVKFYDGKINADNTVEKLPDAAEARKDEAELDKDFFGRVAKTFAKARKDSWKNSTSFDNMEKELGKLNDLLNSNIPEDERDKKLYDALEELDKKADKYLEHKVKKGVNENAVAKVEATASMKEYIKERKAEIYRRQLAKDTNNFINENSDDAKNSPYCIKQAEVKAAREHYLALFDKLNISGEKRQEMQNIFINAEAMMFQAYDNYRPNSGIKANERELASSFLTAEFMRNELLVGGGEITPMMKQFIEGPEAFRRTMESTDIVYDKLTDDGKEFNEKTVKEYASRDTNANVLYSYANSGQYSVLLHKNLFESELAYSTTKIQNEKEALERQKAENAAREKVKLDELKKQEKAKEVSRKQKENLYLSRSYAYLAKFAKEQNLSGPDWDGKVEEFTKLANEFREKAMFGEKDEEVVEEKKTGKASKSAKSKDKLL